MYNFITPPATMRREAPSFEAALLTVSEYLTEAAALAEAGTPLCAAHLLAAAERYAVDAGYVELMRLVWQYETERTAATLLH